MSPWSSGVFILRYTHKINCEKEWVQLYNSYITGIATVATINFVRIENVQMTALNVLSGSQLSSSPGRDPVFFFVKSRQREMTRVSDCIQSEIALCGHTSVSYIHRDMNVSDLLLVEYTLWHELFQLSE